jgi:hypothetical protein
MRMIPLLFVAAVLLGRLASASEKHHEASKEERPEASQVGQPYPDAAKDEPSDSDETPADAPKEEHPKADSEAHAGPAEPHTGPVKTGPGHDVPPLKKVQPGKASEAKVKPVAKPANTDSVENHSDPHAASGAHEAKSPESKGEGAHASVPKAKKAKAAAEKKPEAKPAEAEGHGTKAPETAGHQAKAPEPVGHDAKAPEPKGHGIRSPGVKGQEVKANVSGGHEAKAPGTQGHGTSASQAKEHGAKAPEVKGNEAKAHEAKDHGSKAVVTKPPEDKGHETKPAEAKGHEVKAPEANGHGASAAEAKAHGAKVPEATGHEPAAAEAHGHGKASEPKGHEAKAAESNEQKANAHGAGVHEASGHEEGGHESSDPETGGHESVSHGANGHGASDQGSTGHEAGGHGSKLDDANDEGAPQMAPKPDSAFARAADWEKGQAEMLSYSIKRHGKTGDIQYQGRLVTERMFLRKDGTADRNYSGKTDVEVLNAVLTATGEEAGIPFSMQAVVKLPRKEHFRLLRQDQSLQSWPGATYRFLDCGVTPPRMRVVSSGGEIARDTVLSRWPVYTEEMLFTYLRSLPQRAGYREEVWFQDWGGEGRLNVKPQFATISVRSRTSSIRDMETWYITVDREDGRRSEFWVSSAGMHPVVLAILIDRSAWTLQEISRKKYWSW